MKPTSDQLHVFDDLAEALRAGFEPYVRTPQGFLVRLRTSAGWVHARVIYGTPHKIHAPYR